MRQISITSFKHVIPAKSVQSGMVYKPVSITQILETLDYTIRMGSTPTILYLDLYIYSAYTAHYAYFCVYITFLYNVYEKNKVIVI